ncbi:MAG: hypothetical protein ACYDAY_10620 [Candidatus Dormibacteria bacterium]
MRFIPALSVIGLVALGATIPAGASGAEHLSGTYITSLAGSEEQGPVDISSPNGAVDSLVYGTDCSGPTPGVGGYCWNLAGTESTLNTITVHDAATSAVDGTWELLTDSTDVVGNAQATNVTASGAFCGDGGVLEETVSGTPEVVDSVPVPQGSAILAVWVGGAALQSCGLTGSAAATTGTVGAEFTTN